MAYYTRQDRKGIGRCLWLAFARVCLAFGCVTGATISQADSVRVTTWDLGGLDSSPMSTNTAATQAAVAGLQALNPDLVLLRNVANWEAANVVARALGSNAYAVVVCSAFPADQGGEARQLAVISRRKAYFSWMEHWGTGCGIVFAAIQTGSQRVGFFLAQAAPGADPVTLRRRWTDAAAGFRGWTANRLDSVVVGLSVAIPRGSESFDQEWRARQFAESARAAFPENVLLKAGAGSLVTARLEANPATAPALIASQWPATLDLNVELGQATALLTVEGGAPASGGPAALRSVLEPDPTRLPATYAWASPYVSQALKLVTDERLKLIAGLGGAIALLVCVGWLRVKLHGKRRLRLGSAAETISLGDAPSTAGLLTAGDGVPLEPSLSADQSAALWRERALAAEAKAKQALELVRANAGPALGELLQSAAVQRLAADRSSLLETQGQALANASHLDSRMTRIEEQLRQQSQSYEQHIRELEQDLAAAQQQNRALIQSKIHQLKAEMEAARERALKESF